MTNIIGTANVVGKGDPPDLLNLDPNRTTTRNTIPDTSSNKNNENPTITDNDMAIYSDDDMKTDANHLGPEPTSLTTLHSPSMTSLTKTDFNPTPANTNKELYNHDGATATDPPTDATDTDMTNADASMIGLTAHFPTDFDTLPILNGRADHGAKFLTNPGPGNTSKTLLRNPSFSMATATQFPSTETATSDTVL